MCDECNRLGELVAMGLRENRALKNLLGIQGDWTRFETAALGEPSVPIAGTVAGPGLARCPGAEATTDQVVGARGVMGERVRVDPIAALAAGPAYAQ